MEHHPGGGGVNSAWLGGSRIFQEVSTPPIGWLDKPLFYTDSVTRVQFQSMPNDE